MSDWAAELPAAIRAAIEAGGGVIVVRTEMQATLGGNALERMAPGVEGVSFRVDPEAASPHLAQ